ncbi:MAG: endonuclease III [Deltaproteobacteria bacterium]|nr:endonuclease III [Deltaproteobacteria bacterium]
MAAKKPAPSARILLHRLAGMFPNAHCELRFENPFQLLVGTMLAAQSTDAQVNKLTPRLFSRFPDARTMAAGAEAEIQALIKSVGFFRVKARHLKATCELLVARHGGDVPRSMNDLVLLKGVGRKTANVVLGYAFGTPEGIVVDTHIGRISRRLGFTRHNDPVKVERDLMRLLPRTQWIAFGLGAWRLGHHICRARTPDCAKCRLNRVCPSSQI